MSHDPTPPNTFFLNITENALSVRALVKGAKDNANVMIDGRYYVLMFTEDSQNPNLLVRLLEPTPSPSTNWRTQSSGRDKLTDQFALLDTAKAYHTLKRLRPDVLVDVQHAQRSLVMLYGDVRITIVEMWKFAQEGALVVHCLVENPTKTELRYDPTSLTLRVNNRLYPQDLSDGNGIMPAQSTNRVFFSVARDSEGRPANLSVDDDVVLLFARQKAPPMVEPRPIFRPQTPKARSRQ